MYAETKRSLLGLFGGSVALLYSPTSKGYMTMKKFQFVQLIVDIRRNQKGKFGYRRNIESFRDHARYT